METTMPAAIPTGVAELADYLTANPDADVDTALKAQEGSARAFRLLSRARKEIQQRAAEDARRAELARQAAQNPPHVGRPRAFGNDAPSGREMQEMVRLLAGQPEAATAAAARAGISRNEWMRRAVAALLDNPPTPEEFPGAELADLYRRFPLAPKPFTAWMPSPDIASDLDILEERGMDRAGLIRLAVARHLERTT